MLNDETLFTAADQARTATRALASSARPTALTRRLTVADHADALEQLQAALAAITGAPGVLRSTLRMIMELRDFPAATSDRPDPALADLYDLADLAHIQASRVAIGPARDRVSADVGHLVRVGSPAASGDPAHNVVAARARAAAETIGALAGRIYPEDGGLADVADALAAAADVVLNVKLACLRYARLIGLAYSGIPAGRGGLIAEESVGAAGQALTLAHRTLVAATDAARAMAEPELELRHAA